MKHKKANKGMAVILLIWMIHLNCMSQRSLSQSPIQFEKYSLTDQFISEGVAIGDVNHDGLLDVMAGAYWFEAPHWMPHEIAIPQEYKGNHTKYYK